MKITQKSWNDYTAKLSKINSKAADLMREWITANGIVDSQALIDYAYALVTKYGEAAATLACEMYDATALVQGVIVPPAEPAPTATYQETAIAVNGAKMQGQAVVPNAVDRLVKLAGQDTTMLNARRDGAYWAWVPSGDTCAFCITLASNGWQRQSKKAKNSHAEHIHANCDCAYAVTFNPLDTVEGYNPDKYLKMYNDAAPGQNSYAKINALRRENYAKNKDYINAQKRAAYATRNPKKGSLSLSGQSVEEINRAGRNIVLNSWEDYREKFLGNAVPFDNSKIDNFIYDKIKLGNYKDKETVSKIYQSIDKLSGKYYSPLQGISWMDGVESVGSNAFATSNHMWGFGSAEIRLNPIKFSKNGIERLTELSSKGYSISIPKGREIEYLITHEYSHAILNIGEKLPSKSKNFVQCDFSSVIKARKEIEQIWKDYTDDIVVLQGKYDSIRKPIEEKMLFGTGNVTDADRLAVQKAKEELDNKIISKYSLTDIDEFTAEAFTDAEMNSTHSDYSQKVHDIIEKYFGKAK